MQKCRYVITTATITQHFLVAGTVLMTSSHLTSPNPLEESTLNACASQEGN